MPGQAEETDDDGRQQDELRAIIHRRQGLASDPTPFGPYEAHYLDGYEDGKPFQWNLERRAAVIEILFYWVLWYACLATCLVAGLAWFARKDRMLIEVLAQRVSELEEELKTWQDEAAEIADGSKMARFDRSLQTLCSAMDERTAHRIADALDLVWDHERDKDVTVQVILRELQNAWKPDEKEVA